MVSFKLRPLYSTENMTQFFRNYAVAFPAYQTKGLYRHNSETTTRRWNDGELREREIRIKVGKRFVAHSGWCCDLNRLRNAGRHCTGAEPGVSHTVAWPTCGFTWRRVPATPASRQDNGGISASRLMLRRTTV